MNCVYIGVTKNGIGWYQVVQVCMIQCTGGPSLLMVRCDHVHGSLSLYCVSITVDENVNCPHLVILILKNEAGLQ